MISKTTALTAFDWKTRVTRIRYLLFDSNVVSNNGLDGIQITNYIARDIIFTNNETSNNGRDGIRLETFKGDPEIGVDILIDNHVAQFNIGDGINIIERCW